MFFFWIIVGGCIAMALLCSHIAPVLVEIVCWLFWMFAFGVVDFFCQVRVRSVNVGVSERQWRVDHVPT